MWFKVFILDECLYQICSEVFEYNPCLCYQESLFNYFTRMVFTTSFYLSRGFPVGSAGKESACSVGGLGSIPGLGRSPGEGERLPTPVFWPGEFHGLCSSWGHKESDMTEPLSLLYQLGHQGSPRILEGIPSPGDLPQPRNWTQVSCIAGVFFTSWTSREDSGKIAPLEYVHSVLFFKGSGLTRV